MNLGNAFAILAAIALVLLLLFALLLKCYHMRRQQKLRQTLAQQQNDSRREMLTDQLIKGAYDQFRHRRNIQNGEDMSEMVWFKPDMSKVIDLDNDIYGVSILRKRLELDLQTLKQSTSTVRQLPMPTLKQERVAQSQKWQFIQALIKYNSEGLELVQQQGRMLTRQRGLVKIGDSKIKQSEYGIMDQKMASLLQVYGFQQKIYACHRFSKVVQVGALWQGQKQQLAYLQHSTRKQLIQEQQFNRLKDLLCN